MWGADSDQLHALSQDFARIGERVELISQQLHSAITTSPWSGADARSFNELWTTVLVPSLLRASGAITHAATDLARQADEQQQASSAVQNGDSPTTGLPTANVGLTELRERADSTRREITEQLARLREQLDEEQRNARWSPVERFKDSMPRMSTDAEMLQTRIRNLEQMLAGDRTFLTFSDQPGDNRIIEVYGDLDTADTVIIHVPGMSTDVDNYAKGHHDAMALRDEAASRGARVAVVSFADYNVPDDPVEVSSARAARDGQDELRALVGDLRSAGADDISVVAHSYGTLVVGEAMKAGLDVERVVAVGSPGMGSDTRLGLGSPDVQLYAGSSPVNPAAAFAINPLDRFEAVGDYVTYAPAFGANPIEYANTIDVTGAEGHSTYFHGDPLERIVSVALPPQGGE
jgi:pimeloyl-ACP methyl ester carboxylesterase